MNIAVTAIGTATPPFKRNQTEVIDLLTKKLQLKPAETRLLRAIYKSTGIDSRYSVLCDGMAGQTHPTLFKEDISNPLPTTAERMQIYKDHALPLALQAIQSMLNKAATPKEEITHLITVSCTGMYAPGIDIEIVQTLQLDPTTKRTCINFMGCYGAFNALKLAQSICQVDQQANVLIVCIELCSLHYQHSLQRDNIISNALFADGAAAALIQANPTTQKCLIINDFHCDLLANTQDKMAWHISDSGFDIVLSSFVPNMIKTGISAFTEKLFSRYQLKQKDVDFYAIHPGGTKILEACEKALNINKQDNQHAYDVLRKYGNMSSATILFVLASLMNKLNSQDHNKRVFSCAFGPGLTLESMLLRVHHV